MASKADGKSGRRDSGVSGRETPHAGSDAQDWAHAPPDDGSGPRDPHLLDDHLQSVAALAESFGPRAGRRLAHLAGLWHDLGKRRIGFQRYIRSVGGDQAHIEGRVADRDKTHSAAGALWAHRLLRERFGRDGEMASRLLQYVIAGHHAGLGDWHDGLAKRLSSDDACREIDEALSADTSPEDLLRPGWLNALNDLCDPPDSATSNGAGLAMPIGNEVTNPGRAALWLRMMFSALVDADFLDTEAYLQPAQASRRDAAAPTLEAMRQRCDEHLAALAGAADTPVKRVRAQVLEQCRRKASMQPGVFSLTVPTGGGKTLSSLAFALAHAIARGKRRIVYAIPYTSIIEQTADVFRRVFAPLGDDAVIEHHSSAEASPERETARSRLACENWDAPLVVTTNVQLFESLFARRTSRCRKLHNLIDSVIVLDEAQLLPLTYLQPIVDVLRMLVADHGATIVLCTATQPVLDAKVGGADPRRGLHRTIGSVTEIVDDPQAMAEALVRVQVHRPPTFEVPRSWEDLADEIVVHDAVLAIVNRRADAQELHARLRARSDAPCWHLSALMCAQHRSDTLASIRAALEARRSALSEGKTAVPVRVVSTNLIEAGIDISFPVVFRAMAGLDSIAQAAGRCNREGELDGLGQVHVFVPPTPSPPGLLKHARQTCQRVWADDGDEALSLARMRRYFQALLREASIPDPQGHALDARKVCDLLKLEIDTKSATLSLNFAKASEAVRLIDDKDSATVLARYRGLDGSERGIDALIAMLERDGPSRWLMRKLQRHGVTIYRHQLADLVASGQIREVASCPGLYVQVEGCETFYHPQLGVRLDGAPGDPGAWVC